MRAMRHGPLKLKAQILCGEAIALGPGKADLLEAMPSDEVADILDGLSAYCCPNCRYGDAGIDR